ncbi:MAG: 50S ribosomal protein L20 [bacterium]|nr:50S ribosomal protein L20 [bacterium]
MVRVKRGVAARKHKKNIFRYTKGFRWGRKNRLKLAKEAILHSFSHAFRDRKAKKRVRRNLWQLQINAAVRQLGLTYSRFINLLKKKNIQIDRKILAELAQKNPEIFKKIVETATEKTKK